MNKPRENTMANVDFTRLVDAKQFALVLMEEGVQFAFCADPLSISYPMKAKDRQLAEQPITG